MSSRKWVLVSHDFGYPIYIHDDGKQFTDSTADALVFDERDNPVFKIKYWETVLGMTWEQEFLPS